jgi:hypothetical protein
MKQELLCYASVGRMPSLPPPPPPPPPPPKTQCSDVQVYVNTQPPREGKGNPFLFNDNEKRNQINSRNNKAIKKKIMNPLWHYPIRKNNRNKVRD